MKKILLIILVFLTAIYSFGQAKFQGSLKKGAVANSLDVVIKPTATFTGYPTQIVFNVQVPLTSIQPTSVNVSSLSSYFTNITVIPPVPDAQYVTYGFSSTNGSTTTNTTINSTDEYPVFRVTFTGGNFGLEDVRLAHIAGGGLTTLNQFYVEANAVSGGANDYTNYLKMFYGPISSPAGALADETVAYNTYQFAQMTAASLPLTWLNFSAQKQNGNALVNWQVANQVNNDFFEVQLSTDGRTFSTVGKVMATEKNSYSFTDPNLSRLQGSFAEYRIKQVDKDGNATYSDIKKLLLTGQDFTFSVIGNPIKGNILNIGIQSADNNRGVITIFDLTGKQLYMKNITWSLGYTQQALNIPFLAGGTYTANLTSGKGTFQVKFVR